MKVLIFDPVGGASGDMILAGLVHLGCPAGNIMDSIEMLGLGRHNIRLEDKIVSGISCLHLDFDALDEAHERSWREIKDMIEQSRLKQSIKDNAIKIFSALAEAESCVHKEPVEEIHFHEVGALDSIFDIVGIAAAVDYFSPDSIFTMPLPLSTGTVNSRHGILPVPAPATLKLMEGLPVRMTGITGELVTPTGAAVIKSLASWPSPSEVIIKGSGYGCGSKSFGDWPNIFRCTLCETTEPSASVFVIEADIDDMIPEDWESALASIRASGAIDACLINCIMKNGRPGIILKVMADRPNLDKVIESVFQNTTTIGVRYYPVNRSVLERREFVEMTEYGEVRFKETALPDGSRRRKPESADICRISKSRGIPAWQARKAISKK